MNLVAYFVLGGVFLLVVAGVITLFHRPEYEKSLTFLVLALTLITLFFYANDTRRIANQTVENSLRPVILRTGFVERWDDITFKVENGRLIGKKRLEFKILKNIAKDIRGEFYLTGKKYELLFGSSISKLTSTKEDNIAAFIPVWGWMEPGGYVFAVYDPTTYEETSKRDGFLIMYKDIEGNSYFTKEGEVFSSVSGKL